MVKKIFIVLCLLCIILPTNAYFWSASSTDLYRNIDSGLYNLEDKMLWYELNWWDSKTGIIKEINKLAQYNDIQVCLDESINISKEKFIEITQWEKLEDLSKYLSKECYDDKNKTYPNNVLKNYIYLFQKYLSDSRFLVEQKTKKINSISSIWLFSDWISENSWFDLITDIEEIDKIIFSENTEYRPSWENEDIWDFMDFLDNYNNSDLLDDYEEENDDTDNIDVDDSSDDNLTNDSLSYYQNDLSNSSSNYVCSNNLKNSWLNTKSLLNVLNILNKKSTNSPKSTQENLSQIEDYEDWTEKYHWYYDVDDPSWDYSEVTDNSEWPCEDFFCINIEFIMYNHWLFWWSEESMSIESIIKRSNQHLSKFVSSSLIPAKMSTNLFELWLQHLDLTEIFHMWVQISKKPIPLLNIKSEDEDDETQFSSKHILERYYKENWLDYNKRNSIVLFESINQDKQNSNNAIWLPNETVIKNFKEYNLYKVENNNSNILNKIIEKSTSYWITQNFEEQFIELWKFSVSINDYVENLHSIITKMEKIPIDSQ